MGRASSAFLLLMLGLLLPNLRGASGQGFEYGEPIDITVTAGDSLAMSFGGSLASAIAVSFQQCTGDEYMRMEVSFNGTTTLLDTDVSTTRCLRVRGQGASLDDQAVYYDNLCAFQNSGSVGLGYETSEKILSSTYVDPDYITAEFTNTGTTTASGQVIMFSTEYPAPNLDEAIDRLNIVPVVDGNLFTIEAKFEAHGSETENFCAGATGCAMTIYYIEVDNEAGADQVYGTVCQARGGVLMYEGFTGTGSTFDDEEETDDENAEAEAEAEAGEETDDPVATAGTEGGERRSRALSTTAFEVAACVEFPKNTEARYRLYVVVSPDTESYAQVGYGVQDQLLYASDVISVDAADLSCPEVVEVVGEENSAAAAGRFSSSLTPVRASASVAAGLAAAAASMRTTEL